MGGNKRVLGSNLAQLDAHQIKPEEYDEIPELTDAWFQAADQYKDGKLVRRGRPPLAQPKRAISLRLDPDVLEHYRGSGPGWQGRINEILRKAAKLKARA
jgi:uncharacterized protein (DUF4415 family)